MFIVLLIFIVCVWIIGKGVYNSRNGNNDKVAPDPIGESFQKHSFQPTKRIPFNIGYHPFEFLADTNSKQFALTCNGKNKLVDYIPFDSIVDVELLDDHSTIMHGGVGRAIVGSVLAGGIGAIVGAGTRKSNDVIRSLRVRIITNDVNNANIMIPLMNETSTIKKDSPEYHTIFVLAQEIYSTIVSAIDSCKKIETATNSQSVSNKIKELVQLKDQQLITENEFESKRAEILARI